MKFSCPCCGYPELKSRAYEKLPDSVIVRRGKPPYSDYFGMPSYEVCPCCGFEFGNDDEPGTAAPTSFESHLQDWQKSGCIWFNSAGRPDAWQLEKQLATVRTLDLSHEA